MSIVYHIINWNQNYENNKSREREKCSYVCVPNQQDGMGLAHLLSLPDGAMIYGIWCLILGAASRQGKHRDGWLTRDGHQTGTPWTPSALAVLWRRDVADIERALDVLCSEDVGWVEKITSSQRIENELETLSAREVPAECPPSAPSHVCARASEEEKRIEENIDSLSARAGEAPENEGRPVERPSGAPTLEEVQSFAKLNAILPVCAEKWFWTNDGNNWQDRFGKPLANWRSALRSYSITWAENERRNAAHTKHSTRQRENVRTGIESTAGDNLREL